MQDSQLRDFFNKTAQRSGMGEADFAALYGPAALPAFDKTCLLADIIGNLEGAYNKNGIAAWFNRARTQLGGLSPRDILKQPWSAGDEGPQKILRLAAQLRS